MAQIPRITRLPPLLANQIAAGEVIEHPASVVKELLENAIDAKATQIDVTLVEGGIESIIVRDNGCGILAEDLPLAFMRHATSKLLQPSDLFAITSMGFRGEALASIAAVSKLTLSSKPETQAQAWSLRLLDPNQEPVLIPTAHPTGTSVSVAELFYNTPVRRKFLRSPRTELLQIEQTLKRAALAYPEIGFKLNHNEKCLLQLAPAVNPLQQRQRISKLLSQAFLDQAIYVEVAHQGLQLHGWLSGHSFHRNQHNWIHWFVNQRPVRDKVLLHAFKQAYAYHLPPDRYPACVLSLSMDPHLIDVNVHPTKHEVRFRESRLVHDFIVKIIDEALAPTSTQAIAPITEPTLSLREPLSSEHQNTVVYNKPVTMPAYKAPVSSVIAAMQTQSPVTLPSSPTPKAATYLCHQQTLWIFDDVLTIISMPKALSFMARQAFSSSDPLSIDALLFPLRIDLSSLNIINFSTWETLLETVSIKASLTADNHLLIRELPKVLKTLDAQNAFSQLISQDVYPNKQGLIDHFCEHLQAPINWSMQDCAQFWQELQAFELDLLLQHHIIWQGKADALWTKLISSL